jgi:4-hydroxyphenylpyruvate dioxygenase
MRTSIATVCLSGGLSEKLQAVAAAGFRGVETLKTICCPMTGRPPT